MIHRRLIAKGIKYYLTLPHNTGHGIHSPFLFRLINQVFAKEIGIHILHKIENYRQLYMNNHNKIAVNDFGARSKGVVMYKKVSSIARNESLPEHYGKLLFNLISDYNPQNIIELGTSLGIGTLYLASACSSAKIYTIEGCEEKAALAKSMLKQTDLDVEVITGNFDEQLPLLLKKIGKVDIAFIDGNHQKESTIRYFEEIIKYCHDDSVLVFDDINWSPGMMEAWEYIEKHNNTRVCLDLFRMGIVLLNPRLQKERFTVFY